MKCARCSAALDDGVMVCSQCGAVVGLDYGHRAPPTRAAAPTPVAKPMAPFAATTGVTRRIGERVKGILASPRREWHAIAGEPASASDIWLGYVLPLALIGPLALVVAHGVIGTSYPMLGVVREAMATAVAVALLTFAFALVQVAVLAWGVNAMARRFNATPDRLAALKVVAYSMTPVWLVGVVYLLPWLGFLWVAAALYAFVLAFLGLQPLMRCTPQQALGYAFTALGIAFALWVATAALVTALIGLGPLMLD